MPRVSVILNPHAGRGRGAKIRSLLEKSLPEAEVLLTRYAGEAEALACVAAKAGAEIIVATGGDGTLCEVLNGVFSTKQRPKLAVLPVGTGNDFARTVGIGTDFSKAVQTIQTAQSRLVDVGQIVLEEGSSARSRFFLNVCGTGFDALVAARINEASSHKFLRHLKGTTAYLWAVGSEVLNLKSRQLQMRIDGEEIKADAVLCAIANAKSYGGGMLVAPQAEIDDGFLDIVLIGDVNRLEFLRAFPGVFSGKYVNHPKVHVFRGQEITISCSAKEGQKALPVLVDGETLGSLPTKFNILPRAVEFLVPES